MQPSRRPKDARYGENPNRLHQHHQFQVVLKPAPTDIVDRYLGSLRALGIDTEVNDIRFVEDNWENPTLGAWGLGWEVWMNGMEVTQFTYFQQVGGLECKPITGEITYGLERLTMYLQNCDNVFDLVYTKEIFIFQLEKFDSIQKELLSFVGLDQGIKFYRANDASVKYYAQLYQEVKETIPLTRQYFEDSFNNPYIKHFYSEEDIRKFRMKWEKHVVEEEKL